MDLRWALLAAMDAHPGQAGWAQAVGSVGAVLAAIWIDQGSARRQGRDQLAALIQAKAVRRDAIFHCIEVLRSASKRLATFDAERDFAARANPLQGLNSAAQLVDFYLQRSGETEPRLVAALFDVQRLMTNAFDMLGHIGAATLAPNQVAAISVFEVTATDIEKVLERYDTGGW